MRCPKLVGMVTIIGHILALFCDKIRQTHPEFCFIGKSDYVPTCPKHFNTKITPIFQVWSEANGANNKGSF